MGTSPGPREPRFVRPDALEPGGVYFLVPIRVPRPYAIFRVDERDGDTIRYTIIRGQVRHSFTSDPGFFGSLDVRLVRADETDWLLATIAGEFHEPG